MQNCLETYSIAWNDDAEVSVLNFLLKDLRQNQKPNSELSFTG